MLCTIFCTLKGRRDSQDSYNLYPPTLPIANNMRAPSSSQTFRAREGSARSDNEQNKAKRDKLLLARSVHLALPSSIGLLPEARALSPSP